MTINSCDTAIYNAARMAAESLLHRVDKDAYFRPYFDLSICDGKMRARHASWDCVDMSSRFTDAWICARQMFDWPMTEVEQGVRAYLLAMQNPDDGLFYDRAAPDGDPHPSPCRSASRRCRARPLPITGEGVNWSDPRLGAVDTADMFCQSRAIMGLTSWFLESGELHIQDRIERLVEGLWAIATKKDDFCYYEGHRYSPGGWTGVSAYEAKDLGPTALPAYGVLQILPLTRYWEETKSPAAERLIRGLLNFFVRESGVIQPDGSFKGHLHSWGILPSAAGVLRFAVATKNQELIVWCKRVWDFVVEQCSSFGWVPDGINASDGIITGETCCNTDLIHLGVKLAECGFEDCFDYVEIMLRNQLIENQVRETSRFEFASPDVEKMTLGAYDSWVMPNGLTGCSDLGLEGCCTASAIRAIYLAWLHAVTHSAGQVSVNLMITRRSEWLDTVSHQPCEGRFDLIIHKPVTALIRIPWWLDLTRLKLTVDGNPARPEWVSSHLRVRNLKPGNRATLEFPLPEKQSEEEISGHTYRLKSLGITLMTIDPPGTVYPTYRRTQEGLSAMNTLALEDLKPTANVRW